MGNPGTLFCDGSQYSLGMRMVIRARFENKNVRCRVLFYKRSFLIKTNEIDRLMN
ncbi:hypothetical protein HMPREF0880_01566 [Yokenella regensburgei ATCC 43003]|nr:hypothetical protein HMPREF0880_01566 [Yokenella regensburgei ATCC 43003]